MFYRCKLYPFKNLVPSSEYCDWSDARWGVCWLDFKATLIAVSIIGQLYKYFPCNFVVRILLKYIYTYIIFFGKKHFILCRTYIAYTNYRVIISIGYVALYTLYFLYLAGIVVLLVCCCIVKLCKCMTDCLHIIKVCCCWCCCCCRSGGEFVNIHFQGTHRMKVNSVKINCIK